MVEGACGRTDLKEEEYPPSEDTFFLADYICRMRGRRALDVGSGSGYITKILSGNFDLAVGTDLNFGVLRDQSDAYRTENLVCCSGADALHVRFDLIVCNPPYLATDGITHLATDGGAGGFEVPSQILYSISHSLSKEGGRFVLVTTSLSDYARLARYAEHLGFKDVRIVARKKMFFEELLLLEGRLY